MEMRFALVKVSCSDSSYDRNTDVPGSRLGANPFDVAERPQLVVRLRERVGDR